MLSLIIFLSLLSFSRIIYAEPANTQTSQTNKSNTHKNNNHIKEQCKKISDQYNLAMKERQEAINAFKETEKLKRMAAWYKNNAQAFNSQFSDAFLKWIRKQNAKGETFESYKKIVSTPQLLNKYYATFFNKYNKISKKITEREIKVIEDVTDKKMWSCQLKVLSKLLS